MVRRYKLRFHTQPFQLSTPQTSTQNSQLINGSLVLLNKEAIIRVPVSKQVQDILSNKESDGERPVLDLSLLKEFIETEHFVWKISHQ